MQLHKMLHKEREAGGPGAEALVRTGSVRLSSPPCLGAHVPRGSDACSQGQVPGLTQGLDKVPRAHE